MLDKQNVDFPTLTALEQEALEWIKSNEGCFIYRIPEKNERDFLGGLTPGMRLVKLLDKKGMLIITDEEPMDDGFQFTPTIELSELGHLYFQNQQMNNLC